MVKQAQPKQPNQTDVVVGTRLRLRRKQLEMSQEKLGHKLGITFQQVQKYEKGTNRIGASRLQAIADALGVPVSYFFPESRESAGVVPEHLELLCTPDAVELLRGFAHIGDRKTQLALAQLVSAIAKGCRGSA